MKGFSGSLPNTVLRFFGMLHILLGITILILAFVQLGITSRDIDNIWNPEAQDPPQPSRYTLYTYYPVAMIIFSSLMMMTGGLLGFAAPMSYDPTRQAALVSGFKVLTIFVAIVFAPLVVGIGVTYAHLLSTDETLGKIGVAIAVIGGIEMLGAMLAGCITCCYSPYSYTDHPHDQFHHRGPPPHIDNFGYGAPPVRDYGIPKPSWLGRF